MIPVCEKPDVWKVLIAKSSGLSALFALNSKCADDSCFSIKAQTER